MVETERSLFNTTLEVRIEDFGTATAGAKASHLEIQKHFGIEFSVSAFPNGLDEDTEGWLVVCPVGEVHNAGRVIRKRLTLCVVSIVGIDGHSRFPQYFDQDSPDDRDVKYLKKTFILGKGDELLCEGALRLKCDIHLDIFDLKSLMFCDGDKILSDSFEMFLHSIPQVVCRKSKDGAETGDTFTVFDLTSQILALRQFHWLRKRFGVNGIPPVLGSEAKVGSRYLREHVWMFDTDPDRFLLSLDQSPGSLGRLLVLFSPVIRRCIKAPMREKREKRIQLSNVDSLTFKMVLHFLQSGELPFYGLRKMAKVYKFSHLYEMENLQQRCAEKMVTISEVDSDFEEIVATAELYTDEYLLTLLETHLDKCGISLRTFRIDDRHNFDCYI